MRLTDGERIVEINLYEKDSIADMSQEYFNASNLQYDEETDTYEVEDVDYCIGYAKGEEDPEYGWGGDIVVRELESLSEVEALARDIRSSGEWVPELCEELCKLAGLDEEYAAADDDTVESVLFKAAAALKVEIL